MQACNVRTVSREELVLAMARVQGYDIAATTNAPRFGADVFLDLAAAAAGEEGLLRIRQTDWFPAFLEVSGLSEEQAPPGARLAWQHRQDMLIDFHREQVLDTVRNAPIPDVALAVRIAWPDTVPGPRRYTYEDTLSVPKMRVTSQRVVRYRLLAYSDMIVYDRMEGLSGRPLTGLLGFLFSIIGDATVLQTRIAVSPDEFQVLRARAKKGFISSTSVATFAPNGKGDKGIPADRPDLKDLERTLERSLNVEYRPYRCEEAVGDRVPDQSPNALLGVSAAASSRRVRRTMQAW
jgi:hypothetical protein